MKKYLFLMCFTLLAANSSGAFAEERNSESENKFFTYEVSMTAPATTFLVLPDRSVGGPLESLQGQKFQTSTGTLLLLFSSVEHAYFKDGKLMRYQYMHDPKKAQRAFPSLRLQLSAQVGQKAFMQYFEPELFGHLLEPSATPFILETVDGKKFGVAYDATTKTYAFTVGKSE